MCSFTRMEDRRGIKKHHQLQALENHGSDSFVEILGYEAIVVSWTTIIYKERITLNRPTLIYIYLSSARLVYG